MSIELITVLMFGSLLLLLFLGLPVAFACGTVGIIFTALLQGPSAVNIVPTRIFGLMTNYLLAAIPLFILMACILERGGLIAEIYEMVHQWTGGLKGGVATATVCACALLAAMVGVIGASVVTMGMIALPEMLKRGYDKYIAAGCIVAGGTLGILIPPSVLLIVYGMVDNSSIGQLYAGPFCPDSFSPVCSLFTSPFAVISTRLWAPPFLRMNVYPSRGNSGSRCPSFLRPS